MKNPITALLGMFKPKVVQARFDLAQWTSQNKRHWVEADALSARAAMSPAIRAVCRMRSRYEAENNSWYAGILRTVSNHLIASGPRLEIQTPDLEANTRLERAWVKWTRSVQLAEKLRVMVETYWRDGEVFAMRTARPRNWPISLDIRTYEAEQCAAPWASLSLIDPFIDDGIRVDLNSNEVEYHFYHQHPGDFQFSPSLRGEWFPASDVLHLFRRERPGQVRGIPRCTSSLSTLPIMRRQELATLLASETAANFATYIKSTGGPVAPSPGAFKELEVAANMLSVLPEGWSIDQVDPKHPGPLYEMFQRQALMSFCRCTNMPYALAAGTSKDSNFSSLKGDMKNVWEPEVRTEQNRIELSVIEPIFRWFLEDCVYVPGLLDGMPSITDIDHQWYWPPLPNLDEVDSATAANLRVSTGQSTLSKEHANRGTDYDTECIRAATDFGVTVEQYKAAIFTKTFGVPQGSTVAGLPAAVDPNAAPAQAAGEYTNLGQRDWNNNQKRIRSALDSFIAGDVTEGRTRLTLAAIGLTPETIQGYLDDANDGVIDSAEIATAGQFVQAGGPGSGPNPGGGKEQNFEQYIKERGISDPTAEHGLHGPSGSISDRAMNSYKDRFEKEFNKYNDARNEFQSLVNKGDIKDPTGRVTQLVSDEGKKKAKETVSRNNRLIDQMERFTGKNGKTLPKYQKAIDRMKLENDSLEQQHGPLSARICAAAWPFDSVGQAVPA